MKAAILTILLAYGGFAQVQDEQSYFNDAANMFMVEENKTAALKIIAEGLQKYEGDQKLIALKRLIEEDQEDQDNQDNKDNQDQQKDKNQDQEGENDKEQEGENQQDNKDESDDEGENEKDEKESDKNDEQDQQGNDEKEQQPPQASPAQLSPQQVQNLLEAMSNEEKKVQDKVNAKKAKAVGAKSKKDW